MKVKELIAFLQTQPQDVPVAFCQYSDYTAMEIEHIVLQDLQSARVDGYVGAARPDKPTEKWLVFPGN
jgi:hypothetical protein